MHVETSLRSPAWAMHRSKLVKTFRVPRHERPYPHGEHDGEGQREDAADDPGGGLPEFVACPGPSRVRAIRPRTAATAAE